MNKKERYALAQWVVSRAIKAGADEVAVNINNNRNIQIQYRDKKLEKLKESTQNLLSLDVYSQNKYSGHSTNDLKKSSLDNFIQEAVASTKYLTPDEYRSLPDPKYYPRKTELDLKIMDPDYEGIDSEQRVRLASEIEAAARAASDKIITTTGSYSDTFSESVKIHSNGFEGESQGTYFSMSGSVTVSDPAGGRPSDFAYATTRFFRDLPGPASIGKDATQRALRTIGQKKIESGKYTMIVENRVASRILSMMQQPMSGRALQQNASFLHGMIGKPIASEKFSLIDDPFIEKGLGSRMYDGEGMAAQKRIIIDKGILKYYYIDNYYSKKLGMEPTTGSPANMVFEYGSKSLNELIKETDRGILVTRFIGGNSNPARGDFSYGIVGLLINKGEIVHPVNEMNISGNAKAFWMQLVAMGNDPFTYSGLQIPSMVFEDIQFSGL